ncbi:uncharacterized protein B0T15DRAFT_52109 [Chaetomium strumarium]|uniref:Uncharacterized protein n=1 Tax=Chaetomium strumarium TaxID=1170767 RepID=A0AAJ0M6G4_9PEZI|nr:hypothetical protein B0T15DRAFT_52109 [Chaetomium strumarium]
MSESSDRDLEQRGMRWNVGTRTLQSPPLPDSWKNELSWLGWHAGAFESLRIGNGAADARHGSGSLSLMTLLAVAGCGCCRAGAMDKKGNSPLLAWQKRSGTAMSLEDGVGWQFECLTLIQPADNSHRPFRWPARRPVGDVGRKVGHNRIDRQPYDQCNTVDRLSGGSGRTDCSCCVAVPRKPSVN